MDATTKKYVIISGIIAAVAIVGFAGYKMGWFSKSSSKTSDNITPPNPPQPPFVTGVNYDSKKNTTTPVAGSHDYKS